MFSSKRADQINYARVEGIEHKELPAAIIFAAIYVPLLCLCLFYSVRSTYVYKSLTLFCIIRIVAFVMRAVLAASATAGNNVNLVVAQMVIYNIGFSGLLYSAYGLVLDRYSLVAPSEGKGAGLLRSLKSLIRNRMLFRAAVTAAIVLGIVGGVYQANLDNPSQMSQGNTLRKASLYIFLGVVCLLCLVTIDLAFIERNAKAWNSDVTSIGRRYGVAILLFVSLMLILREAYLAATTGNIVKQNKPATWYTLVATPETLCMFLFMVPGLVPNRQEISESQEEPAGWIASSHIPLRPQV